MLPARVCQGGSGAAAASGWLAAAARRHGVHLGPSRCRKRVGLPPRRGNTWGPSGVLQEGLEDHWRGTKAASKSFRANYLELWDKVGAGQGWAGRVAGRWAGAQHRGGGNRADEGALGWTNAGVPGGGSAREGALACVGRRLMV